MEIIISRANLIHNLNEYQRQYPNLSFAPVLKSNAYGHGLGIVAGILDKAGIAFFVVDSLFEAMMLRNEGIESKILVIGYTSAENIKHSRLSGVAFTVTSLEQLQAIASQIRRPKKLHLKIDTGMNRQGILPSQTADAIKIIQGSKNIELEGLCSHLADADNRNTAFTDQQIKQWESAAEAFKKNFPEIKHYHLAASAGVPCVRQSAGNVARLGIGLYGLNLTPGARLDLKPVLRMQSIIGSVKTISAGESVGYGLTYKTSQAIKIATVPAGYYEGVDRKLANQGFLKIGGHFCPIIGRVSMNITTIDVSVAPDVRLGDKAVIISDKESDKNSVVNLAALVQTIPYEILIHLPPHLRRKVV